MSRNSRSSTASSSTRVAALVVAWRVPLAIFAAIILAIALPLSWRLEMDRTIDQMFAADDPTLLAYRELQDSFGGNAVVMLVYRDPELLTPGGLERAGQLSQRVAAVSGVRGVLSVAQLNDLLDVVRPGGLLTGLSVDTPALLRQDDLIARAFERLFVGYTHSEDGDQSAIVTLLETADEAAGYGSVVQSLRAIASNLPEGASDAVLVGEPVLLSEGFDLIERDGARLAGWTIALLSPLVLALLRGIRWAILQGLIIVWAVTVTRASLYLLGIHLSLVSSILTAICTVIAVTAVIHLGTAWLKRKGRGDESKAASVRSMALVMPAIFWACATDAAGFISLIASAIVPIQDFAIMMGIASMAVWAAVGLIAPIIMTFAINDGWQIRTPRLTKWEQAIRRSTVRFAAMMIRFRWAVLPAFLLLTTAALMGVDRLRIETSFLKNFHDDSEISQSYDRVEKALRGAGVWDIVLDAPAQLTDDYLKQVRALEKRLRDIEVDGQRLTKVLSMSDADRIASSISLFKLVSPEVRLAGMRSAIPAFSDALLVPRDQRDRKLRIMLRSREHLPAETKMALIKRVEDVVQEVTTTAKWYANFAVDDSSRDGNVTGYYVMIARLVSQIIGDQWRCLAWAAAMVWGLLVLATRSLRLASLSLIPNLLPVLGVLGVLGWLGNEMNMGAAMIAAVSVGLSIDGSVHFLSAYRRKKDRGRNDRESAIYAQRGVGLPIIVSTLALVVGFAALGRSEFVPTATFGILTAAALLLGSVVNLTLLPILVSLSIRSEIPKPIRTR